MSVLSVLEKNPVRITSERCPDNSGSLSQIGKNNQYLKMAQKCTETSSG